MTVRKYLTIFLISTVLVLSCTAIKISSPTLTDLLMKQVTKVSLKELLLNEAKYQGQIVETEGELISGFEDFSIHYYDEFPLGDTTIRQKNYFGLGLKLHHDLHFDEGYFKNLNDKTIRVRGVVDTMNYEKISGLPDKAVLKNVFYFQKVDNVD